MEPMGKTPAIASKLNTLLRMGLVSKNNVRRAMTLFADPEKAMKNPAYRMLMQEILMDVVDRVVNNKSLYATMRASVSKEPATVIEGVEKEREKTLLRSGLVKKKDVLAARRALESPAKAKSMGSSKVYRDMMITMLDSMVKKITGSPVLFNAFKTTLGKEEVEESFEVPTQEGMDMFWLCEDAQALMEKNKPTKPELWSRAKAKARAKFDVYPSAYANGWAVKWYNEQGGGWKSVSEGKTFFNFMDELDEEITPARQAVIDREKEKASKALNKGKTAAEHGMRKKAVTVDEGIVGIAAAAAAAASVKKREEEARRSAENKKKQDANRKSKDDYYSQGSKHSINADDY